MEAITSIEELIELSKEYRERRDKSGSRYADEAYAEALKQKNHSMLMHALREKLHYAMYVNADFVGAEELANQLLAMPEIADMPIIAAQTYNIIGICKDVAGSYIQSRDCYLQTVTILEKQSHLKQEDIITLGNAYHNIAKLYTQIDVEQDDRMHYINKALSIFEKINYREGLARIWNMQGGGLPDDTPIEERLAIFEKAATYYKGGKDINGEASCIGNIGLCYCHMGQYDKGLKILHSAIDILNETNNGPAISFTLFQCAEALRMKGDNHTAIEYLEKAEAILKKANARVYLNVIYREWAVNLAAIGKHAEAYEKMNQHLEEVEERLYFDRQSAVEEAKLKFELNKKERESDVLRKKNEEVELFNEKLKQSNEELNQFAYVASHDLKEPLRMVSNYMQLLEKSCAGKLDEDQQTYMRYANEGAKRMYKLIDSLLTFSRATIDTELRLIDLNDVLDDVERIVSSSSSKPVRIDRDDLPSILGDYSQMSQLFQNLVANAVKYNEANEIVLYVAYKPEDQAHRIEFHDNGIGIPEQYREQVFDIFKRLHSRDSYSGTGIGLSICKKIIHRLNGRIWVEDSLLGTGSAFVFTIPKKSNNA